MAAAAVLLIWIRNMEPESWNALPDPACWLQVAKESSSVSPFSWLKKTTRYVRAAFCLSLSLSLSLISGLCLLFDGGVGDKPLHFWVYSLLVVLKKEVVIGVLINASDIVTNDSSGTSLISFCIHSFIHPVSPLFMVPPCVERNRIK